MDKFSDFILNEKNISTDKHVQGKKDIDPKIKSTKSNYTNFLGATGHKKKFKPRDRVSRSNYEKSIGRRKRKGSKTKMARNILAKKYGIKKAIHKDKNKRYVLKHLDIQNMIKKMGYVYDNQKMIWTNNEVPKATKKNTNKPSQAGSSGSKSNLDIDAPDSSPKVDVEKDENEEPEIITTKDGQKIDVNETKISIIGNGGIEYDVTEDDLRSYSARLMLARFFDMPSALKFEEAEEEQEDLDNEESSTISVYVDPVIPRDKVMDKIESLGYSWSPDAQEWQKNSESIFKEFSDNENFEEKKVMTGRILLAIIGYLHAFEFIDGKPEMEPEEVLENMGVLGFAYNNDVWEHFNG